MDGRRLKRRPELCHGLPCICADVEEDRRMSPTGALQMPSYIVHRVPAKVRRMTGPTHLQPGESENPLCKGRDGSDVVGHIGQLAQAFIEEPRWSKVAIAQQLEPG